ncbi:MAG: hypothetical protein KGJ40_02075 [candidate division NC10 bacterium]|nr:hypothetical protein [candidate division NC10 bacterium]
MTGNLLTDINGSEFTLRIARVASLLVMVLSSFFGFLMTSYGLSLTHILPTQALISQRVLSHLLAFVIHASLAIVYIALSLSFGRRRIASSLGLLPPFIALATITIYFSFLSTTYEAKGSATFVKLLGDIKTLNHSLTQSDDLIKSTFLSEVAALEKLARDSDRGFDETAIAACGPICRTHLNRRSELIGRFSALTQGLPDEKVDVYTNITDAWRVVAARYDRFWKKVPTFDEFVTEVKLPPVSWPELKTQYAKAQENFAGKDAVDEISLAANRANSFVAGLLSSGEMKGEDAGFFLFLVVAVLPELINVGLMLALVSLCKPAQIATRELEQTLEDTKRKFKLERELLNIRNLHEAVKKAQGKIFRNDVESK